MSEKEPVNIRCPACKKLIRVKVVRQPGFYFVDKENNLMRAVGVPFKKGKKKAKAVKKAKKKAVKKKKAKKR